MDLPAGTRNYNYAQDMAIFRTKTHWAMLIALFVILVTGPLYWGNYWLGIASLIGINIIAATGLSILVGYCGQLSIGHAGFIAVGAYTTAILTKMGVPFPISLICAGLAAGLIGMVFGIPSMRVKGFYLAISTIAAQFIIIWVIDHWSGVTGGFSGFKDVPYASILWYDFRNRSFFWYEFRSMSSQFYLIATLTVIFVFFAKNIARTRVGRAFIAVRDNDLAAEVMGINLFRNKLLAFFIGCFYAGIAGALLAHWVGFISSESFTVMDSILYVGMIIIGGVGTTVGPIFGVVFIRLLDVLVTKLSPALQSTFPGLPTGFTTGIGPTLFGLAIILFLIFEPRGIAHRWSLFKAAYRLWPFSY